MKSLQFEQRPIDPIEQKESAKDSPLKYVSQVGDKEDSHKVDGGKGRDKLKNRRPKLSFKKLLAKYEKIVEANVTNRSKKVQSSKLPPKHKSQEWNWQGNRSHAAATYSPFEQPIPMSYVSQHADFHPNSSWGWFDQEAHVPSYFRPQYVEYAAPKHSERSSSYKDCFDQNRSGAQAKEKVAKQVYRVKYDGRKEKSSYLNSTIEKPITLLKNLAIDGMTMRKSSIDFLHAKSEQRKVKAPKIKKDLSLSKSKIKLICSIGLLKWQEKKLQKLSAEKLKEKGLAWVPKENIQTQKDDAQVSGATKVKKRRRFEKQLPNWKFAPNHQNQWLWHHPYSLSVLMWNSSHGMHSYPSTSYFGHWYGSLCYGGLQNYFAYQ